MTEIRELDTKDTDEITELYRKIFTAEPWHDDWSDEGQLSKYIRELIGCFNSLTYGLYRDGELVGLSLGRIRHWYEGTEYFIDELCVRTDLQGQGLGTFFIKEIEGDIVKRGMKAIFLLTGTDMPAHGFYVKRGFEMKEGLVCLRKLL